MIYSSCRLRPLSVATDIEQRYLIRARYRQQIIDYLIYRKGLSLESPPDHLLPFCSEEIRKEFPHINFDLPWIVEFCSGTGEFLLSLSKRFPGFLFIGVEVALPCIHRALLKVGRSQPNNILFYYGEGKDFLIHDFQNFFFHTIMVNFPDPWPKKRHVKRRIISSDFVGYCKKRLLFRGELHTATDVESLHLYHREIIDPLLIPLTRKESLSRVKDFYYSASRYQDKNLSQSKKVFYTHHYKN